MYDHRINLTGTTQLLSLYKYVHCAYTHVTSYTHEYFEFVLPAYQCVNVPVWDEVNQQQDVRISQIIVRYKKTLVWVAFVSCSRTRCVT